MRKRTVQIDSAKSSPLLRRAERVLENGDLAKAERLYGEHLAHQPNSFDALHGLGQIH